MTDFDNLKNSYIFAIQSGLDAKIDYQNCKFANEFIHKFCENYVDNSGCCDADKTAMKNELKRMKETLSQDIETYYNRGYIGD